jgi:CubicO group peptidase (beta-lactamase class C family)
MMTALVLPATALTPQEAWDAVNRSLLAGAPINDSYPGGNIMASFWVWQDGEIVLYEYSRGYGFDDPQHTWSGTKAVLGVLTGIAIHRGYIEHEHQYVIDFFPDAVIRPGQEDKKDMTVHHLLTMTSGLPSRLWHPNALRQMFVRADAGLTSFLAPQITVPGEAFHYCQGGPATQALVGVIERATGQNLYDFARYHLFKPLGMDSVSWTRTQSGSPVGGFGLYISPRDWFTFGQLHLQDGVWNGRRLLPNGWIAALTPEGGYIDRDFANRHRLYWVNNTDAGWSIRASGMRGNHLNMLIEHNTMVVRIGRHMGYLHAVEWFFSESGLLRPRCWLYIN